MVKFSASRSGGTILPRSFSIFSAELNREKLGDDTFLLISEICLLLSRKMGERRKKHDV